MKPIMTASRLWKSGVSGVLVFAAALASSSAAYALEASEIIGTWQDGTMRIEISADHIVMGFKAPNYDEGVEKSPVTFQDYQGGLLVHAPDGSGFLVTLLPDGHLGWVFPGVGAATLSRVEAKH